MRALLLLALASCTKAPAVPVPAAPEAPPEPEAPAPEAPAPEAPPPAAADAPPRIRRLADPDEGLTLGTFTELLPGLELGLFESDVPHPLGDGRVRVARVDPEVLRVVVHTYEESGRFLGADSWAAEKGLLVAFNPSMFHPDGSGVFQLRTASHSNQATWRKDGSSALVVTDEGARLLDVNCDGRGALSEATAVVQSWRLLDCAGNPTWKEKPKIWSHALLGADSQGRLLFVHARTPWSTRTFTTILKDLPLDVKRLHYAEGGPEASLVVVHDGLERVWVGSYETGFTEHDRNRLAWNLPNIIGVTSR